MSEPSQIVASLMAEKGWDRITAESLVGLTVERINGDVNRDALEGYAEEVGKPWGFGPGVLILPHDHPCASVGATEVLGVPVKIIEGIEAPLLAYCTLDDDQHVWTRARKLALHRDGFVCVESGCGVTKGLHVHHLTPVSTYAWGCRHHVSGLVTLCPAHHRQRHGKSQ